jgi:hypothetical protein
MQPTIQQALRRIIRSQPQSAHWAAKVFQNTAKKSRTQTSAAIKDLIRQESEIGSKLFGEIPSGHKREFFALIVKHGFGEKPGEKPLMETSKISSFATKSAQMVF